jgi:adenosylcobinamide kinase / adenosylcobinamide-phosphate guanylyltransferase
VILIGGGSRSGKSTEALRLLRKTGSRLGFIATGVPSDDEMRERIERHRAERGVEIITWEEPLDVAERILAEDGRYDAIVVDCLTLWLSNLLVSAGTDLETRIGELLDAATRVRMQIIFVTNEVGCGIVPDNPLARRFRDEAGLLNQRFAERASEVYWMVFGLGIRVK